MEELKESVQKLVAEELERANKQYPLFNSTHEGYAVIKEEIEEAEEELIVLNKYFKLMWDATRYNANSVAVAETIYKRAIRLASESIQVAAMAQKFIDSVGTKNNE